MKANKKSFLVYFDLEDQTEELTNEQLGLLFRAMMAYGRRGECIEIKDPYVKACFRFVMVQMREDREKYEKKCKQNHDNAVNRGRPPKNK